MSDGNPTPSDASTLNRTLLVGTALTLLALLLQVATPAAPWVVLYGP